MKLNYLKRTPVLFRGMAGNCISRNACQSMISSSQSEYEYNVNWNDFLRKFKSQAMSYAQIYPESNIPYWSQCVLIVPFFSPPPSFFPFRIRAPPLHIHKWRASNVHPWHPDGTQFFSFPVLALLPSLSSHPNFLPSPTDCHKDSQLRYVNVREFPAASGRYWIRGRPFLSLWCAYHSD